MVGVPRPRQHNGAVDVTASLEAAVQADALFEVVSDLGTYPDWLDIVPRAVSVDPDGSDVGPAWSVNLRGQIGPLRRSKRLRMVRTVAVPGELAVFERHEVDDRTHSDLDPPRPHRRGSDPRREPADDGAALRRVDVDADARPVARR